MKQFKILLLGGILLLLSGCAKPAKSINEVTSAETSKFIEQDVNSGEKATVGDVVADGASIILLENTFDEDVVMTLEVLSDYQAEGFQFFGQPVSLTVKGKETVMLNQPAAVIFKIPEDQLSSIEKEENIFAAYYNGESWEYFRPDSVNIDSGIVEFTTYHFSDYAVGQLSREEQLRFYAQQMAANTWAQQEQEKNFIAKFEGYLNDTLTEAYGIENKETTRKILQTMVKEIPYMGGMLVSAANGDELEFAENFASATGKVILDQMELDGDFMGDSVTISSTYGKIAGDMSENDYEEALKNITKGLATAIISKNIAGKMLVAGAEIIDVAITDWKDKSIEDAYQAYKNGSSGEHGYDLDAGDFEQLRLQMKGINHKIYYDGIEAYCKRNKISAADLTKEQEESIRKSIDTKLKQEFDNRIAKEGDVDKQKSYHEKVLKMFDERGLLKEGSFGYAVGMTLEDRIEKLYLVMGKILSHTDKKLTLSATAGEGEISIEDVCKLMGVWYSDRTNGKTKYFEALKEMGHAREEKKTTGDYAWVLVEVIDGSNDREWDLQNQSETYTYSPSYSRGAYSVTTTYIGESDDYYDPPYVNGESLTVQANWSIPPEVIQKDDVISLNGSIATTANTQSAYKFSGSTGAWLDNTRLATEDGKTTFETNFDNNYESQSGTVTATFGEGSEGSKKVIEINLYSSNKMFTQFVYEWKAVGSD
ncbi:MAG: hypothetical protein AAGU76_13730 [Sedimentibacter sp.]|uniref:hypothetical protein n=1 Tax=Sedimentibacter sp. TaxID=1960295 RepID=UPI0031587C1D